MATWIIGILLALVVGAVVLNMVKDLSLIHISLHVYPNNTIMKLGIIG